MTNAARVIFISEVDGSGIPYDRFSVVAYDGEFSSESVPWTIGIVPPPIIQGTDVPFFSMRDLSIMGCKIPSRINVVGYFKTLKIFSDFLVSFSTL